MQEPGSTGTADRRRRPALHAAGALVVLSAAAAVAWWLWLPRRGAVFPWAAERPALALVFAVLQLLSLLLAARLVIQARRSPRPFRTGLALVAACGLFCAHTLNFVAPALGAPLLTVVGFASFGGGERRGPRPPGTAS
jgi:hypothetical protein